MVKLLLKLSAVLILAFIGTSNVRATVIVDTCEVSKYHGQGYTTTVDTIIDSGNGSYTISLRVEHNGCGSCKKLNHYSVEADPGTYSNISVQTLSGCFTYSSINYGPYLSGCSFQGFRINNTNGIGNGQAAAFLVTYTLTGGLQDQQTLAKTSSSNLYISITADEFQSYLDCHSEVTNIFPYYNPPENGKIVNSLIGAELTSLYEFYADSGYYISDEIFQVQDSLVEIEVFAQPGQFSSLLALLQTSPYGLVLETSDTAELLISGFYPIPNLLLINDLPSLVNYARPDFPGITSAGIVTSQGDIALRSYVARNGFNLDGSGVKIGVLSDSYNTQLGNQAADDVQRGDLPGTTNPNNTIPVDVLQDYPYGTRSDEGRAMLQIIHDIAPKAELAFRTGFKGAPDFANGIRELQLAGCDIIVDDITYLTEPFLKDGIVAQAVEDVVADGVAYFSAAGNFGTNSYQSDFTPYPAPPGITGTAHDFSGGSGDIFQGLSLTEGNYTIVLQWDDGSNFYSTGTDMDIYLARDNGSTLFGFNRNNIGGSAIEILPFLVTGDAQTNLLIVKASGSSSVYLKYVIFRGSITVNEYFTGASTLIGQSNAQNAIAVGAVLYSNTPEFGVNPPTVASFSSRGGTPVNGAVRSKPDFCAPNGVNTTVDLGGVNIDGDAFPNFFGTSAAAPHAAAVAALIIEAKAKFYDSALSPAELRGIMQNSAIDMGTTGFDFETGYGFIQADAALSTLANPSPVITGILYDTTLVPGVDTIPLTITGQYLTDGSVIYFNGEPLASGTTNTGNSILTGNIPPFTELYPEIQVYNPPLPGTNGTDGGLSNSLYFTTRKTIVVSIDDKTKKYGEVLPEFTAVYTVVSPDTITTLEGEGLDSVAINRILAIPLETVADALSNVGLWEIRASLTDPLNPDATATPVDSIDLVLLEDYNFHFESGLLTVSKLDVVIKPRDAAFVYGDSISGFEFDYLYNNDTINPGNNVVIAPSIVDSIDTYLETAHTNSLVTTVAKVPATALVNEWGEPLLDSATLVNTSILISEATANAFATALVNGTFISPEALYNATALVNTVTRLNQSVLVPATALVNGTALVNTYDGDGNLVSTNALFYATALVNSTAQVNSTTINVNSNSDAIAILGDGDILILSGDSIGSVNLKSINMITGSDVGEHWIIPGTLLSNNFNLSYGLGKLTINPVVATVTAEMKYIKKGDPLPTFTATFDGFINGETDTVVNSLTFSLSPAFIGQAGVYDIIPSATADNYIFTPVSAPLYVNPYGYGAKYVKVSLVCVEELSEPDSNGFTYVAHYKYTNNNATPVYIPVGSNNNFYGYGDYNAIHQPVLFMPGSDTIDVPFDGVKLTWKVKSYQGICLTLSSTYARYNSPSCDCFKSAEAEATPIVNEEIITGVLAYPNPVRDLLNINLGAVEGTFKSLSIFDNFGRSYNVDEISNNGQIMEVNMSGLGQGLYFVRLNFTDRVEVVRVIKQ